ncbi:hypothetical protein F5Y15DRAFT_382455 [Xylariaceae sp. FL0016]|nr:hypothetical protein F5Y15DRAFT_382455 [Xylariaceae sp. FL0016]
MDLGKSAVMRGYKGDPDRTIGIVGPVPGVPKAVFLQRVVSHFPSTEAVFGFDDEAADVDESIEPEIKAVAIMNAFHPEEVDKVANIALGMGIIPSIDEGDGILYLTGAVRELGLQAALVKRMAVICVGHRTCEEWGIEYMAEVMNKTWPPIRVDVILEDESVAAKEDKPLASPDT